MVIGFLYLLEPSCGKVYELFIKLQPYEFVGVVFCDKFTIGFSDGLVGVTG